MMISKKNLKWLVIVVILFLIGIGWYFYHLKQLSNLRYLMALTDLDGSPAPNFTLSDQNGKTISLNSFKGKIVVLQFMDPKCKDICPIESQEIMDANQNLGSKANQVVFLAVNVNQYYKSTEDLTAFTKEHGLNHLSNWYFLTGTTSQLQSVWKLYGIDVVPNPSGDVEHSSYMFFIDQKGRQKLIANPGNDQLHISQWGQGISTFVKQLL